MFQNVDNIYVTTSGGLGSVYYIRKKAGIIESLYMSSDMWGQYGPAPRINHRPLLESFVKDLVYRGLLENVHLINNNDQTQNNEQVSTSSYQDNNSNQNNNRNQTEHSNQTEKIIKCPLCRTENNTKDIITIKGLSETCKVCLVNEIEKCFSACNHACICAQCLESL